MLFKAGLETGAIFPMNVSLTPELDKFVADKVESGRYNSASEVVREALRLLEEHDRARGAQIAAFNKELGARLASLESGIKVNPQAARKRIEEKSRARRQLSA
jgi:antitoxin ParD1/3/4